MRANSGEPQRAVELLGGVAEAMREQGRDLDATRVRILADTVAELYAPVATEADRLRGLNTGDRIVLTEDGDAKAPRVYTVGGAPATVQRRFDGTVLSVVAATGPDSRPVTIETDTANINDAAVINPAGGGQAQEYLPHKAAGEWVVVAAGQQLPQDTAEARALSRRAVDAFYAAAGQRSAA